MRSLLLLTIVVAACSAEDRRSPPPAKPLPPALAHATQADLARELDAADRNGTWTELRHRWQGQTLHWTVIRHPALCNSAASCNVAAFPIQRPAKYGWMPELALSPEQYAALAAKCGAAETCELSFTGTLAKLEASPETPTRLRFEGVTID